MSCNQVLTKLLRRFIIFITYSVLGALLFYIIEKDDSASSERHRGNLQANLTNQLKQRFNLSSEEVESLLDEFKEAFQGPKSLKWTMVNSFYFINQILTTIGYGNITPQTTIGRVVCIPYALTGIPICALFLQAIGKTVAEHQKNVLTKLQQKVLKKPPPVKNLEEKSLIMTIIAVKFLILVGALEFSYRTTKDNHTYISILDGIYVWFMTLTTVGFGDLVIGIPGDNNMHFNIFQPVFTILGLAIVSTVLNNISDCIKTGDGFYGYKFEWGTCTSKCRSSKISEESRNDDASVM